MEYTVAFFEPATEKYTLNSLEKVGKEKLEAVLQQTVAESTKTLPPKSYYGKQVRYKDTVYTVVSFNEDTKAYTISSVVKVGQYVLEVKKNRMT